MAIDEASPDRTRDSDEVLGGTDQLRALLVGYAGALETINDAPAILWTKLEGPRLLRWLRVPAPRGLVRTLLVRHFSRCVSALKCGVAGRAALGDDAAGPKRDLEMLERFEQSLPTRLRLALIWPLGLLGVLLLAFSLANFSGLGFRKLLGDLTTAAVNLNRTAAIAAFQSAHRYALVNHMPEAKFFAEAAMIVAWSAALVIVPLLPAFAAKRQLLAPLAGLEARGFAALGARTVHDVQLDLIGYLLLLPAVALLGIFAILVDFGTPTVNAYSRAFGAVLIALTILAGVELLARYAERRAGAQRRHGRITRLSLRLVSVLSLVFLVALMGFGRFGHEKFGPDVYVKRVREYSWFNEVSFMVTAIMPNAACHDPYRPLEPGQQFLRFDLEVWSTVDQFVDPAIASGLSLRHWSVEGSDFLDRDLYMYTKCGDGTEAISQPIIPGTHTKTVVVVNAPKSAAFLQLDRPSYYGLWRWPIPPAGG
ncbi:MAG: hypothetical protein WBM01_25615 [Mycobacterium sp.]